MKIKESIRSKTFNSVLITFLFTFIISGVTFGILGYKFGLQHKTIVVHVNLDDPAPIKDIDPRYPIMPKEMSEYICSMSEELKIDPDLVVAILLQENPTFDPSAEHKNPNGTFDLGIGQLNTASIYTAFLPEYWDIPVEFNPFNWKHNLFICMHYIQDLSNYLKIEDDIIMAYNAGIGRVSTGDIPSSTYKYLAAVKNNLCLLRGSN